MSTYHWVFALALWVGNPHLLISQDEFGRDTDSIISIRAFDIHKLDSFRSHPDFIYKDAQSLASPNWIQKNIIHLTKFFKEDLFQGFTFGELFGYSLAIIVFGSIFFAVYKIGIRQVFSQKAKAIPHHLEEFEEDIEKMDFEKNLQEAKEKKSYKLGIRLLYLETLKALDQHNLINWAPHKVNQQYLRELKGSLLYIEFENLTKSYEYVCYGNVSISLDRFNHVEQIFRDFQQKIEEIA